MRNLSLGMVACLLVSGAAVGQEPMPLQVMPNSPAGRAYGSGPSWQAQPQAPVMAYPPQMPAMAYPPIYPAVWQFTPNTNSGVVPAYQNDYLPNPGMAVGPPLQGPMTLPPLPLSPPNTSPKGPIIQASALAASCASAPPACAPEAACVPPAACGPAEPYLVETNPWQPVRCNRYYAMGDYLLWWTKKQSVPDETSVGFPAFVLPSNDPRNGARALFGAWLNPSKTLAFEVSGFWLANRNASTFVDQGPNPNANVPLLVLGIDAQTSSVQTSSQLWGAEADFRYKGWEVAGSCCRGYVDFLAGFRYLNLSEGLVFNNSTLFTAAPVLFTGALVETSDSAVTHNNFYAPQLGFEAGLNVGRFNVSVYNKIALGINDQVVSLNGQTVLTAPPLPIGGNAVAPGGLLVQSPGRFSRQVFSYMPEAGLNLSFKLAEFCQIGAGYSFLFLGNVVRPGDHFPPSTGSIVPLSIVTMHGIPATGQPPFTFTDSNFWAQGANVRLTFIF